VLDQERDVLAVLPERRYLERDTSTYEDIAPLLR
jgi:hypothetical protein